MAVLGKAPSIVEEIIWTAIVSTQAFIWWFSPFVNSGFPGCSTFGFTIRSILLQLHQHQINKAIVMIARLRSM